MSNSQKLIVCFSKNLMINMESINDNTSYGSMGWDSVAHMALVASIEEAFDIMLDTDEVIEMSTYAKAKKIVSNHGVILDA